MATKPSKARKTHHRDVGRKNFTAEFPKGVKREGETEPVLGVMQLETRLLWLKMQMYNGRYRTVRTA